MVAVTVPGRLPAFPEARLTDIPLDMFETRDDVVVQVALPGDDPEHAQVELDGNRFSIKAERLWPEREGVTWLHVESPYGTFHRTVTVGPSIQADRIEAACKNGLLISRLPKAEQAKPKPIPVCMDTRELEAKAE